MLLYIFNALLPCRIFLLGLFYFFLDLMLSVLLFVVSGAASGAERPFPLPEFPHIHVRLVLVPHPLPHLPPSTCRHTHLWYIHVWGRKHFTNAVPRALIYHKADVMCTAAPQGLEIIFRVGLAILQYNQTDLIQLDMEGMSQVSGCSCVPLSAEKSFTYRFSHETKRPTSSSPLCTQTSWTSKSRSNLISKIRPHAVEPVLQAVFVFFFTK